MTIYDDTSIVCNILKKGDTFLLQGKLASVTLCNDKQTRVKRGDKNYTRQKGKSINICQNQKNQDIRRAIEGELLVDWHNEDNPLHIKSDCRNILSSHLPPSVGTV